MKPVAQIAAQFKLPEHAIADYFRWVQLSFRKVIPNHRQIAQFIASKSFNVLPKPRELAIQMIEAGYWSAPLRAEEAVPVGMYIPSKRKRRDSTGIGNLDHSTYLDRERVAQEKLEHCPHGVPRGKVCAICNPDEFHEMTGIE